jgi:diguanylate cyclase (GGDEF)-like protein
MFGVMSAVPVLLLAYAMSTGLRGVLHDRSVANAEKSASLISSLGLPLYVSERQVRDGLRPAEMRTLNGLLATGFFGDDVRAMEIRSADGIVVYSRHVPAAASADSRQDFAAALGGRATSAEMELGGETAVRISVPITYSGSFDPAGVATMYMSDEAVHAAGAAGARKLSVVLFGGLALFYLLLFPIVARASNTLRRQAADNERLARQDALTGLPNRIVFRAELEAALRRMDSNGAAVVVMVIDVDRFKDVNDQLGHHNGDLLLRTISDRLRKSLREVDVVARIGGDEFGVVMPRANASFSQEIASRLRDAIAEPITLDGTRLVPSASIGIAFAPEHGGDFEALFHEADLAMYGAKERGGGRFRIAETRRPARPLDAEAPIVTPDASAAPTS